MSDGEESERRGRVLNLWIPSTAQGHIPFISRKTDAPSGHGLVPHYVTRGGSYEYDTHSFERSLFL